eukprot:633545-Hanusia_phi.AAC.1
MPRLSPAVSSSRSRRSLPGDQGCRRGGGLGRRLRRGVKLGSTVGEDAETIHTAQGFKADTVAWLPRKLDLSSI